MADLLLGVRRLSNASGVEIRLSRGRVAVGSYEGQATSRKTVSLEVLNGHGEYEVLLEGSEWEVARFVASANRLYDVAQEMKLREAVR